MRVSRKKYMELVDYVYDDPTPFREVGYDLYEKGFTQDEVSQIKGLHVYPRPRFNDSREWSKYPPMNIDDELVIKLAKFWGLKTTNTLTTTIDYSDVSGIKGDTIY